MVDLAGPDAIPFDEVVRQFLKANRDPRTVITDEQAAYVGISLKHRSLVPDKNQLLGVAFRSLAPALSGQSGSFALPS